MNTKCGGKNVPAVAVSEIPNRRETKIILHIWIIRYRVRVELEKYGSPPVSRKSLP